MPMPRHVLLGCLLLSALSLNAGAASPPTAEPLPAATVFEPGLISGPATDGAPTFTPDGNTLYFTRATGNWSVVLESHKVEGRWSEPRIAPFSGEWSDSQPALAPDGSFLVFVSWRPETPEAKPAAALWRVARRGNTWEAPVRLPASVNINARIFRPSIAGDGSLYFMSIQAPGKPRIFRAQYDGGGYQQALPLPFSGADMADVDPEVAPDESFLLFSSAGRWPGDTAHERLFIVRKQGPDWGDVQPLRYAGDDNLGASGDNEPRLSADHRSLYFSSDKSMPVRYPRTREQTAEDLARAKAWDNTNPNVWVLPFWAGAGERGKVQ